MEKLLALGGVQATSRFAQIDGRVLHYLEAGSGSTLVLLHGASGGCANWYRLVAALARSHRVLVPDLPGYGLSQALRPVRPLGVQVAGLLLDWLDVAGVQRCSVCATSFGGLVALRMAQRDAQRVTALVIIDSVGLGRELPALLRLASMSPLASLAVRPSRRGIRWQLEKLMMAHAERIGQAHLDALSEYLWQSAAVTDRARLARAFSMFSTLSGQREVLTDEELRSLAARTLVIWGEHDRFLPVGHGRRAAALVPNALFRIIPDAGHSPNWEAPDAVFACLSTFLSVDSLR